jgi:hypothetical protein
VGLTPFPIILLIVGLSGIVETLPFLLALPLIRSLYLHQSLMILFDHEILVAHYAIALGILLVIRFAIGLYAQNLSSTNRLKIQSDFKSRSADINSEDQRAHGRSVQSINFLFNGISQLFPGLLFTISGIILSPRFGLLMSIIVLFWILPLRILKQIQDSRHQDIQEVGPENTNPQEIENWFKAKRLASMMDSVNKNAREFVVITTLLLGLFLGNKLHLIQGAQGLFVIIVFLRGLQQIFTAYIMTQQIAAARKFLKQSLSN